MTSSASKTYECKILCLGRGVAIAKQAEEHLRSLGYKNLTVDGSIENNAEGDEKLTKLLTQADWDAVSFGGGLTGYDEKISREVSTLYWFNRLVNIVHERAPNAKLIFVENPEALVDGFHRVLDSGPK